MSQPSGIMLDPDAVRVLARHNGAVEVREVPWSPDAPEVMVETLRAHVGSPSALVIVVGLGFLEVAAPELPKLDASAKQALLWRDADRYFPIVEPAAIECGNVMAMAMSAKLLDRWIRALRVVAPVRAVISAPSAYARVLGTGAARLSAGVGESGVVEATDGLVRTVRRASTQRDNNTFGAAPLTIVNTKAVLLDVMTWLDMPTSAQLVDATVASSMRRDSQKRWASAMALTACAVALLLAAADHSRNRQLTALQQRAAELSERARPAMLAETRVSRARAELALLTEAETRQGAPDSPLAVMAQLTRVLPRDAFVQRLEFDGQQWRVDGTADNAPRLVPLLDGNAQFRDVRIAAPSQRFVDLGRPRESFAISFRMRSASGGADGAP